MICEIHYQGIVISQELEDNANKEVFERLIRQKFQPKQYHDVKFHYLTDVHVTIPGMMVRAQTTLDELKNERLSRGFKDGQSHTKRVEQRAEYQPSTSKKVIALEKKTAVDDLARSLGLGPIFNTTKTPAPQTEPKEYPSYRTLTEKERLENHLHVQEWEKKEFERIRKDRKEYLEQKKRQLDR